VSFTGERWAPELVADPRYQGRYTEYAFARQHAHDRIVLDVGSGDGYAAYLLAENAREVIGFEVAREAVQSARQRYQRPNLRFEQGSATRLEFPDDTFDLVTSFQVIEHLPDVGAVLDEIGRVLKPDGRAVITTPNRLTSIGENPYHVQEYSPDEFRALFDGRFAEVTVLGYHGSAAAKQHWCLRERVVRGLLRLDFLRLRQRLPRALLLRFYPMAYRMSWAIRRVLGNLIGLPQELTLQDFFINDQHPEAALGLIAVAAGPLKAGLGHGAGIAPRTGRDEGSGVLGDSRSAQTSPLGQGRDIQR
jgi:SAM-dependent methyltransferase